MHLKLIYLPFWPLSNEGLISISLKDSKRTQYVFLEDQIGKSLMSVFKLLCPLK